MVKLLTETQRESKRRASRKWQSNNRAQAQAASRKSMAQRRSQNPVAYWEYNLRKRSEDRGLEYDLTSEWIAKRLAPMVCELTGLPLKHTDHCEPLAHGRMSPWAPSFDRIESTLGYTKNNVQLVCWALNVAKGPWDLEVFDRVARAYVERIPCL